MTNSHYCLATLVLSFTQIILIASCFLTLASSTARVILSKHTSHQVTPLLKILQRSPLFSKVEPASPEQPTSSCSALSVISRPCLLLIPLPASSPGNVLPPDILMASLPSCHPGRLPAFQFFLSFFVSRFLPLFFCYFLSILSFFLSERECAHAQRQE